MVRWKDWGEAAAATGKENQPQQHLVVAASAGNAVDYAKAWATITRPDRAARGKVDELAAYLEEQGIVEGGDLEVHDEEVIATIRGYLNNTGKLFFNKAMGGV